MCIGGVCRDITDPENILSGVREIRRGLEKDVIPVFHKRRDGKSPHSWARNSVSGRCSNLRSGRPNRPRIRIGNGYPQDFPYAAYQDLDFKIVTLPDGDIQARIVVRALEMLESVRLIRAGFEGAAQYPDPNCGPHAIHSSGRIYCAD